MRHVHVQPKDKHFTGVSTLEKPQNLRNVMMNRARGTLGPNRNPVSFEYGKISSIGSERGAILLCFWCRWMLIASLAADGSSSQYECILYPIISTHRKIGKIGWVLATHFQIPESSVFPLQTRKWNLVGHFGYFHEKNLIRSNFLVVETPFSCQDIHATWLVYAHPILRDILRMYECV